MDTPIMRTQKSSVHTQSQSELMAVCTASTVSHPRHSPAIGPASVARLAQKLCTPTSSPSGQRLRALANLLIKKVVIKNELFFHYLNKITTGIIKDSYLNWTHLGRFHGKFNI